MRVFPFSQIKFNPVTVVGYISKEGVLTALWHTDQLKSKGIDSGPTLAEKTFLNSSYVIVPELSLLQYIVVRTIIPNLNSVGIHIKILEGHPVIRIRSLQQRLEHRKIGP